MKKDGTEREVKGKKKKRDLKNMSYRQLLKS